MSHNTVLVLSTVHIIIAALPAKFCNRQDSPERGNAADFYDNWQENNPTDHCSIRLEQN
jgi:hypothetical protein